MYVGFYHRLKGIWNAPTSPPYGYNLHFTYTFYRTNTDDVSGKGWAADERLDYKGMVYIYKGEEVFLEVLEHARSFGDSIKR